MIHCMKYVRKYSPLLPTALAVLLVCLTFALEAGRDIERASLKQLSHELAQLEPLITKAESASDRNDRVRFRYDWLRRDIADVREGIETFLSDAEFSPRSFQSLQGEYHQ